MSRLDEIEARWTAGEMHTILHVDTVNLMGDDTDYTKLYRNAPTDIHVLLRVARAASLIEKYRNEATARMWAELRASLAEVEPDDRASKE